LAAPAWESFAASHFSSLREAHPKRARVSPVFSGAPQRCSLLHCTCGLCTQRMLLHAASIVDRMGAGLQRGSSNQAVFKQAYMKGDPRVNTWLPELCCSAKRIYWLRVDVQMIACMLGGTRSTCPLCFLSEVSGRCSVFRFCIDFAMCTDMLSWCSPPSHFALEPGTRAVTMNQCREDCQGSSALDARALRIVQQWSRALSELSHSFCPDACTCHRRFE